MVQSALDAVHPKIQTRILECSLSDFTWSPGLLHWQDQKFRSDMKNAFRIYPHQNNTGGFFMALIEKIEDTRQGRTAIAHHVNGHVESQMEVFDSQPLLEFLEYRFGMPLGAFRSYVFFKTNAKVVSIMNRDYLQIANPRPETLGFPFIHINMKYPKLTTAAAMVFGKYATKHVLQVRREQADAFLKRKVFSAQVDQIVGFERDGYVIVKYEDIFLGVGLFYSQGMLGSVHSQFPKAWRIGEAKSAFSK